MRINKYIAECGVASRRGAEKLIQDGLIEVNGVVVTNLATEIKQTDIVKCEGKSILPQEIYTYIVMNKPKGVITTVKDEHNRKTVMDLLDKRYGDKRLFPVGRLDYDTEGLLLLTNDGDLANRLTHPSSEITKTYVAKVEGELTFDMQRSLREGVEIDGTKTKKCRIKVLEFKDGFSRVEVVISEGRNRQVRRMFEAIGKEVKFLKRTAVGDFRLRGLKRGEYRELNQAEVGYLKNV